MSAPPLPASFQTHSPDSGSTQYNGNIIIASLALLCFVVLFILALHIYAKWFWRRSQQRQAVLWHRRQPLHNLPEEQQQQQQQGFAVGLDKAVIDSLPTFIYRLSKRGAMECAVCLSELQENDEGRLLPKCSHSFHSECIDMWFLSHTTCPLCRTSAGPAEPQPSIAVVSSVPGVAEAEAMAAGLSVALGNEGDAPPGPNRSTAAAPAISEVLPSSGWRWRRSTSDRFSQNQQNGVQFPTNVLFWGNNSHVSSHTNPPQVSGPPRLEHGQRGARSLPHMALDMPIPVPRSLQTLMAARSASSGAGQPCPASHAERPFQQQDKAAGSGLSVFKRLLSRERKVFPTEQEMSTCGHAVGMSSEATASGS